MASVFICEEPVLALDCIVCGNRFQYRNTGGRRRRFCTPECKRRRIVKLATAWRKSYPERFRTLATRSYDKLRKGELGKADRAERYASKAGKPVTCKRCRETFLTKQVSAIYCSTACMAAELSELNTVIPKRECAKCGSLFKPNRLNRQQKQAGYVQKHCSYECAGLGKREKPGNRKRRQKRLAKGGYWHPVDPFKVFDRDGWRCHLCGVKTLKSLRGTTDDRAPELDHIDPIAAGGKHVYENCACACRRCNNEKGAKPLGQLLLFG